MLFLISKIENLSGPLYTKFCEGLEISDIVKCLLEIKTILIYEQMKTWNEIKSRIEKAMEFQI